MHNREINIFLSVKMYAPHSVITAVGIMLTLCHVWHSRTRCSTIWITHCSAGSLPRWHERICSWERRLFIMQKNTSSTSLNKKKKKWSPTLSHSPIGIFIGLIGHPAHHVCLISRIRSHWVSFLVRRIWSIICILETHRVIPMRV